VKPIFVVGIVVAFGLVIFALMKPQKVGAATAQTAPGINLSGIFSFLGSKVSAPASAPSTTTATSNYLADQTAASDNASGVVGFGGWNT
jgi:preprotein translocase subunit SecG